MRRLAFGLAAVAVCGFATLGPAQQTPPGLPTPRVHNAFPAGAKSGTSVEVTVTGADLDEPTGLLFSHPGLKAEYTPPKPPEPDPKKKDAPAPAPKMTPNGPYKFKVTADAGVPPGTYDVRFVGKWGVSNPRAFVVGDLNEVVEKEPNNDVPEAQKVELGTTVNGVIANGTDVDYTSFTGKKGQRVILSCRATSIDSKARPMIEVYAADGRKLGMNRNYRDADALADVVLPADGDYLVRLFEFTYQTGSADHFYRLTVGTAPWIDAVFPPAVEPGKPAQVTLYGRNLPGGQPAEGITIDGRPVEKLTVTVTPPADPQAATKLVLHDRIEPVTALQDGFEYRIKGPGGESNPVPIYFAREKVVLKKNAGGTKADTAEAIPTPCEVAGMISRRGDRDWYSFEAKKGEVLYVEVTAERTGAAADFYLNVYNPANKMQDLSGELDDDPNQQTSSLHPFGFYTRTADPPEYKFTAPADGKYLVAVGCRESAVLTGPRTAYRLRVGPAKPDFRAVVMPYSRFFQTGSSGWQNGTQAYDVFVHRVDGFNGPVTVTAEGLPNGVTARPVVIGPTARWGVLNLDIKGDAAAFTGAIRVTATADVAGKPLARDARPATVTWGTPQPNQNVPVVARLDQSLVLAVRPEKGFFKLTADTANATIKANGKDEKLTGPIVVKQGEKVTVPMKATWTSPDKQNITIAAEPMMQNQQAAPVTVQVTAQPTKDKPEGVVVIDVKNNAMPGKYSVSLRGDCQVPFVRDPMTKKGGPVPTAVFADPIEVTVLPTSVAKVSPVQVPNGTVKAGQTVEVVVKVERQYDYAGEFKVAFVPPKDAAGVTAADVTIPAGQDEAKLTIKAAADAKPGAVTNATITVTATYDGKPIAHEAKVTFNVAKDK
ncbi:MAG: PPC domain-containing protein [Gemmataceae bacterium]|nr:PPC domain-containing protein [Gemmataceae bacterium]